jgi:hypothetical protein
MKQTEFDIAPAMHVRRGGLIGKVQAYVDAYPWQECGEIAKALSECPVRVSNCLNKLKLEGNAEQIKGAGRSNKSLWAGASEAGSERREAARTAVELARDENAQAKTIERIQDALRKGNRDAKRSARDIGLASLFKHESMEA